MHAYELLMHLQIVCDPRGSKYPNSKGFRSQNRCSERFWDFDTLLFDHLDPYPKALRTHILRLLGPKTYEAFGLF